MANIVESAGIVLSIRRYKERDYLVKIFLKDYGKLMFFVRGSKRPNQRLTAVIQPFTIAHFIVQLNSQGLSFIKDASQVEPLTHIQQDIFKNAYGTYICGLVDASMEDRIPALGLYNQLAIGLELLDQGLDGQVIMNIFEVKLLYQFGVMPELRGCVICYRQDGRFDYSSRLHGLLCPEHFDRDDYRLQADPRAVHFIRQFAQLNIEKLRRISVSDEVKGEMQRVIDTIYEELVGVHLKSKTFIQQMQDWGQLLQDNND